MTFALTGDAIITRRLSPYREPGFLSLVERMRSADAAFTNLETAGGRVALISVASTSSDEDRPGPQRKDLRGRPGLSPLRYRTTWVVSEQSLAKLRDVAPEAWLSAFLREGRLRFLGRTFMAGDPPGRRTEVALRDLDGIWRRSCRPCGKPGGRPLPKRGGGSSRGSPSSPGPLARGLNTGPPRTWG